YRHSGSQVRLEARDCGLAPEARCELHVVEVRVEAGSGAFTPAALRTVLHGHEACARYHLAPRTATKTEIDTKLGGGLASIACPGIERSRKSMSRSAASQLKYSGGAVRSLAR